MLTSHTISNSDFCRGVSVCDIFERSHKVFRHDKRSKVWNLKATGGIFVVTNE